MNRSSFDRWIHESYRVTAEGLGLYRIFGSLMILFFLMPRSSEYTYLASLPDDFFAPPPGPMMLFEDFPPESLFWILHACLFITLIMMLIGYKTKYSSVLSGVLVLILQGFLFSVGKINHELLIAVVPIMMAFSNWGAVYSVDQYLKPDKNNTVESWPLSLLALFIGFMMFTAGFPKILGGWLDPATQATQGHFLNQYLVKGRDAFLADYAIRLKSILIWEAMDWGTIIFETGFFISVLKARWFKLFVTFAVFFHFSTLMVLNISFLPNFLAYAAFLNWTRICDKLCGFGEKMSSRSQFIEDYAAPIFTGLTLFLFFLVIRIVSNLDLFFTESEVWFHEFFFLAAALITVLYLYYKQLLYYRSGKIKSLF